MITLFFARATDHEALAPMAGDEQVQEANYQATLAVTIAAEPADVWSWLVQIGYRRGGLYSYDWLDRLFGYLDAPSAEQVLPEFQRLKAGDTIPMGRGPAFPVVEVLQTMGSTLFMALLEPAAFIMTRKMLLGIKRRAELLAWRKDRDGRHAA